MRGRSASHRSWGDVDGANEEGCTALHCAAKAGRLSVLRLLKDFGANLDARTQNGMTAFEIAAQYGHHHLVSKPALWDMAPEKGKYRPDLHVVSAFGISLHPRPGRVHWTDVNQKRLRVSAMLGDAASVKALLKAGADPTAKDERGRAASQLAEQMGFLDLADDLNHAPVPKAVVIDGGDGGADDPAARLDDVPWALGVRSPATEKARKGENSDAQDDDDHSVEEVEEGEAKDVDEYLTDGTASPSKGRRPRMLHSHILSVGESINRKKGTASTGEEGSSTAAAVAKKSGPRFAFGDKFSLSARGRKRAPPPAEVKMAKVFRKHESEEEAGVLLTGAALEAAFDALGMSSAQLAIARDLLAQEEGHDGTLRLDDFIDLCKEARRIGAGGEPRARPKRQQQEAEEGGEATAAESPKKKGETVGDIFRRFDRNKNDLLEIGELRAALTDIGLPLNTPEAFAILNEVQDKRGLSMAEFRTVVKRIL